ncbi:NUDIX hydrolase [Tropicimonas sp. IMCC6043]|uniref:NUDIX hydrolase n=1 Tax=Tropicimonas sp. IMCC6043 TaxID=2510645 RepID=UPI00101BA032|nr:NUDIX hydrolase [Tropicimonas sp. IMCC6043]RYH06399.1 NUDIX domain-containing protein [Tropicimonas sp. IMCC6043]
MSDDAFSGAKLALLVGPDVLTILRDERPGIAFPGLWDLPGGGREGDESPLDCLLRELWEELGLVLDPWSLRWRRRYGGVLPGQGATWFFAARLDTFDPGEVRFGDEGQEWRLMPATEFIASERAVPHMRTRLRRYLEETATVG